MTDLNSVPEASLALRMLRLLPRGYGKALTTLPAWVWGGEIVQVATEIGPMAVPTTDPAAFEILLRRRHHDVYESELVRRLVSGSTTVVDVGASVGWYSCLAWHAGVRDVLAVEPNADILRALMANASIRPGIRVVQAAAGARSGTVTLYRAKSSDLSSTVRVVGSPVEVPQVRLDDICVQADFVKCDVEGGEIEVLEGAEQLCASRPVWMLEAALTWLAERGRSLDDLEEVLSIRLPGSRMYFFDSGGMLRELSRLSDIAETTRANVFVVPPDRHLP